MKKIYLVSAIVLGGLFANKAQAQISVHIGFNLPVRHVYVPAPQPVDYPVYNDDFDNSDDYYYLPEVEAYYSIPLNCYFYNDGSRWVRAAYLPGAYRSYDWRSARRYEVRGRRPYMNHETYRSRWGGNANWNRGNNNYPGRGNDHNNSAWNRGGGYNQPQRGNGYGQPDRNQGGGRGGWGGGQPSQPDRNQGGGRGGWGGGQQQPSNGGGQHGGWGGQNGGGQQQPSQPSNGGQHGGYGGQQQPSQPSNGGQHGGWGGQNGGGQQQPSQPSNGGGQNGGQHGGWGGGQNGGGQQQPAQPSNNGGGRDRGNGGGGGQVAQNNGGHNARQSGMMRPARF